MSPIRMSRIESAVRVVLAFNQAFNRNDVAGMMELVSDDCEYETASGPDGTLLKGKEAIAQYWRDFMDTKPGLHLKSEDVFGLGFRTIMRWRFEWDDENGEKKHIRGVDIFQVNNGLIDKQYSYVKGDM